MRLCDWDFVRLAKTSRLTRDGKEGDVDALSFISIQHWTRKFEICGHDLLWTAVRSYGIIQTFLTQLESSSKGCLARVLKEIPRVSSEHILFSLHFS
jgi:hypothetical protein